MQMQPAIARYRWPARLLHWLMALIVICMIPVGIAITYMNGGPLQDWLYAMHKSFGFVVLVLVVLRLGYRLGHRPPPLPPSVPLMQRVAAEAVHVAIYVILFAMPILGWLGTSAYGAPMSIFGLFDLPPLLAKDEPLSDRLFDLHQTLGLILAGLIVVHVGAALMHRFVIKDTVLQRMWPP